MYFAIWRNRAGQYWFRIVGANAETLAHSEMYTSKQSAESTIAVIRRDAAGATVADMTDRDPTERP